MFQVGFLSENAFCLIFSVFSQAAHLLLSVWRSYGSYGTQAAYLSRLLKSLKSLKSLITRETRSEGLGWSRSDVPRLECSDWLRSPEETSQPLDGFLVQPCRAE